MDRKFQKRTEDFTCGNCGCKVTGDGYTNHCPECLYRMHVYEKSNKSGKDDNYQMLIELSVKKICFEIFKFIYVLI
ncbi:MAG TPA: RNHCP domain-containing protein [Ignavibacteria bacterium]|nr:RNHCP domain-containing protein [Ignavibacteria bacterium]